MRSVRPALITLLTIALGAASCGGQSSSDLVLSSDPELAALAAELLPDLALRAGMELSRPVRLEKRSRSELVRYLETKLDQDLPAAEARSRAQVYAFLGLVEPDMDLRAELLALYTEQVAGFYEPDSMALFVMDDQPEAAIEALLIHELVHAVQDQNVPLRDLTDRERGNDRATAAMAAIEGHATLVMFEYLTEQLTGAAIDLSELPDFEAQIRPALEGMNQQFPALAEAPRVIRESLLFPYVDGAVFVQRLWSNGDRQNPFGARLPNSTEQILNAAAENPLNLGVEVLRGDVLLSDVLGSLELRILLEDVLGLRYGNGAQDDAEALAAHWDGDRYVLVRSSSGVGLAWVTVWSDVQARDRFVSLVQNSGQGFGSPTSIIRIEVDGRPAALLRSGDEAFEVSFAAIDPA